LAGRRSGFVVVAVALALSSSCGAGLKGQGLGVVKNEMGRYVAPSGACAVVVTHEEGDRIDLHVEGDTSVVLQDVTGWAWVAPGLLVATASPIYGVPGVYLYRCGSDSMVTLVRARHRTEWNPDGADYFELAAVRRGEVRFWYAEDADSAVSPEFETQAHLYRVGLDGRGFGKVR
jgi:hypothetical protein